MRENVINSLQLAKQHNLHMMTFGKSGSCVAADGRAEWGIECLFPENMNEIIAMMPDRHRIIIQGAEVYGSLTKKLDTMIDKVLSPAFRYNRAKKDAIDDEKRRKECEFQQSEIQRLNQKTNNYK